MCRPSAPAGSPPVRPTADPAVRHGRVLPLGTRFFDLSSNLIRWLAGCNLVGVAADSAKPAKAGRLRLVNPPRAMSTIPARNDPCDAEMREQCARRGAPEGRLSMDKLGGGRARPSGRGPKQDPGGTAGEVDLVHVKREKSSGFPPRFVDRHQIQRKGSVRGARGGGGK